MEHPEQVSKSDLSELREKHANKPARLVMYTTSWCPDCTALKHFLTSRGLEYDEVDIEQNESAADFVMEINGGKRSVPTLAYGDYGTSLSQFSSQKALEFLREVGVEGGA